MRPPLTLASLLRVPQPLLLALLTAVVLHGMALGLLRLRQPTTAERSGSALQDNTPELVRFSLQQASQDPRPAAANPLSLPMLASLPPPRWSDIPDRGVPGGQGVRPRSAAEGSGDPHGSSSSASTCSGSSPSRSRQAGTPRPSLEPMLSALAKLQIQARESPPAAGSAEGMPPLLRPQGNGLASWTRLWEKAAATATSELPQPLPGGVELRRIDFSGARSLGLGSGELRRQAVLLGDRLLLIWPQEERLWILQAAIPRTAEPDSPPP